MQEVLTSEEVVEKQGHLSSVELERFSRTIGALGGPEAFRKVSRLRLGFVGAGRMGTALLYRFVKTLGVRRVAIVDSDTVEPHNLGESVIYDEGAIGQQKAFACENWLALHHPEVEVAAVPLSVTHGTSIDILKRCDVLFCSADHPAGRLAAAAVAAAYGRTLIDIGTLIPREGDPVRRPGIDVRLVVPDRCLLDFGGIGGGEEGMRALASPDLEASALSTREWREERAGSLDSLNDLATCLARRIYERYVTGQLDQSIWCQLDEPAGVPLHVDYPWPARSNDLSRCFCRLAGWGDAGIPRVLDVLNDHYSNRRL